MPAATERTVLHVLPHPGGGGEAYVDLLAGMSGYSFEKVCLAADASATPTAVVRGLAAVTRMAGRHDLLHVHGEVAAGLCLPLLAYRPSFVTLHGLNLVRRVGGARRAAARLNLRAVLRAADRTICVSESEYAELACAVGATAAGRAVVVRNGVELPAAASADERLAVRESLGLSPSETLAIWVGALAGHKDPLAAVRAAEEAAVRLLVVGDGPLRAEVEHAASQHASVLGQRADVPRLLAAADVFVLTSHHEGLSFSLLEAMAHGLAPVVTDLPENREAIGDTGIAVDLDDGSLVAALRWLAESPVERASLGEGAYHRASKLFSATEMERQTHALYEDVFADARHSSSRSAAA
jgi:glycosyltransferase involved in cell wall biosynthesis